MQLLLGDVSFIVFLPLTNPVVLSDQPRLGGPSQVRATKDLTARVQLPVAGRFSCAPAGRVCGLAARSGRQCVRGEAAHRTGGLR